MLHLGFFRRNDPGAGDDQTLILLHPRSTHGAQMAANASVGNRWMMKVGLKALHGAAASVCSRVTAEPVNTTRSNSAERWPTRQLTSCIFVGTESANTSETYQIRCDVCSLSSDPVTLLTESSAQQRKREWRQQTDSQAAEMPEWNQGFIKWNSSGGGGGRSWQWRIISQNVRERTELYLH